MNFLFEVFTVWGLITGIQKVWFYYDTRFAFPVQLMFWGNILFPLLTLLWSIFCIIRKKKRECFIAGLLICSVLNAFTAASVAALTNKYYLSLGGGTLNQYLLFVLIDLLFLHLCLHLSYQWFDCSMERKIRRNTDTMRKHFSFSGRLPQS